MTLDKLEVDYIYEAIHNKNSALDETLVVTKMDNAMQAKTLIRKDPNSKLPSDWYLFVDAAKHTCHYNFILLGHKNDYPEYTL